MAMVYPFKKYNYEVTIDGKKVGGFSEVSAPDISSDPIEYREGNFAVNTVRKQPGLVKYGNITLKWGLTDSMELYNWMKEVEGGTINATSNEVAVETLELAHEGVTRDK